MIDNSESFPFLIIIAFTAIHVIGIGADEPLQHALLGQGSIQPGLSTIDLHDKKHRTSLVVAGIFFIGRPIGKTAYFGVPYIRLAFFVQYQPIVVTCCASGNFLGNAHGAFTCCSHFYLLTVIYSLK